MGDVFTIFTDEGEGLATETNLRRKPSWTEKQLGRRTNGHLVKTLFTYEMMSRK